MFTFPGIRDFDIGQLDPTKLDLTCFDVRRIELPVDVDRIAGFARDAAYVGVGAAVVTAQRADERRRALTDQVTARVRQLVDAVA